jgi:hypothetical protein
MGDQRPSCAPDAAWRVADLDDSGFIEFIADELHGLVRVDHPVWTG